MLVFALTAHGRLSFKQFPDSTTAPWPQHGCWHLWTLWTCYERCFAYRPEI